MTAPSTRHPSLAIALSGGGHRATLFALGVLMYVVDAKRNRDTTSIASVSGGSLTNGFVAQTLDFRSTDTGEFDRAVVAPLAGRIARRGTLYAPWGTKLYLACLAGALPAALTPLWLGPPSGWQRAGLLLAGLLLWVWLVSQRGRVCAAAFRATLFSPEGHATRLDAIAAGPCHVLCTAELQTAEAFYLSRAFVYGFAFGTGQPGSLPLHVAVQASAAFPGAFPPVRLRTAQHAFEAEPVPGRAARGARRLVLADGGAYDNMADEWARGFRKRSRVWRGLTDRCPAPTELVVVNASARERFVPLRLAWVPLWNELHALLRVIDVMYVNTTNVRRQAIVSSHSPLEPDRPDEVPSVLIQIEQSPFDVATKFLRVAEPRVKARAEAVIGHLGEATRSRWAEIARLDAAVPTTLNALGGAVAARLLYHGYVTAMSNLHVLVGDGADQAGWPLLPVPPLTRFELLVR